MGIATVVETAIVVDTVVETATEVDKYVAVVVTVMVFAGWSPPSPCRPCSKFSLCCTPANRPIKTWVQAVKSYSTSMNDESSAH